MSIWLEAAQERLEAMTDNAPAYIMGKVSWLAHIDVACSCAMIE
jgi:hypothetical protein